MRHWITSFGLVAGIVSLAPLAPVAALAEDVEDAMPGVPFKEGDVLGYDDLDKLKNFLPPEFWENREYFFWEGVEMEIGPPHRDYSPSPEYQAATAKYSGRVRLGRDGALLNYRAGLPFPGEIDCKGDPDAGLKIIWNFRKNWNGSGVYADWFYSYWDRGEQLPLYYKGYSQGVSLAYRVEPQYESKNGDVFVNEKRKGAGGITVEEPFDARGIMTLSYSYKAEDGPLDEARNADTWVWIPDLRRVRRISSAQRTDAVAGTDFTMDDLRSFNGIPPQYDWQCLGEATVVAPMNARELPYPYSNDYNFGPYGFSWANERWELRDAWVVRFDPKNDDHPYHHKDIYIDKNSLEPLYSFAYDRKGELWKIIWHNHRWSEDWLEGDPKQPDGVWYPTWEGISKVNDLFVIGDIIVNVQTGTGNRIEFANVRGVPPATRGKIRKLIDIGRLTRGR